MVEGSDQSAFQATKLADRLRELREDRQLKQKELSIVLSTWKQVGVTTISAWENPDSNQLPPLDRIKAYARLFCTSRSFAPGGPRLLRDDELSELEREEESRLYDELLALRSQARSGGVAIPTPEESDSIWRYPDGGAITIICSDAFKPPEYADQNHQNYTSFARFADLDALFAVYGQIKSDNPKSDIEIMSLQDFDAKNTGSHVVIIGGQAADDEAGRLLCSELILPAAEETQYEAGGKTWDSHIFRFDIDNQTFKASFDENGLTGDIGVFARGPHPSVRTLTVTVCNGITSRGVLGAARCFIDPQRKVSNEHYVKDILSARAYCILMNVQVLRAEAVTPDLSLPDKTRCYKRP